MEFETELEGCLFKVRVKGPIGQFIVARIAAQFLKQLLQIARKFVQGAAELLSFLDRLGMEERPHDERLRLAGSG